MCWKLYSFKLFLFLIKYFRSILKKSSRNSSRACSRSASIEDLDVEGKHEYISKMFILLYKLFLKQMINLWFKSEVIKIFFEEPNLSWNLGTAVEPVVDQVPRRNWISTLRMKMNGWNPNLNLFSRRNSGVQMTSWKIDLTGPNLFSNHGGLRNQFLRLWSPVGRMSPYLL